MEELQGVKYAVAKETLERVMDLLEEIVAPTVLYSQDEHAMAIAVIEQNQANAREICSLFADIYGWNADGPRE